MKNTKEILEELSKLSTKEKYQYYSTFRNYKEEELESFLQELEKSTDTEERSLMLNISVQKHDVKRIKKGLLSESRREVELSKMGLKFLNEKDIQELFEKGSENVKKILKERYLDNENIDHFERIVISLKDEIKMEEALKKKGKIFFKTINRYWNRQICYFSKVINKEPKGLFEPFQVFIL
jgi:hypothetical protein